MFVDIPLQSTACTNKLVDGLLCSSGLLKKCYSFVHILCIRQRGPREETQTYRQSTEKRKSRHRSIQTTETNITDMTFLGDIFGDNFSESIRPSSVSNCITVPVWYLN